MGLQKIGKKTQKENFQVRKSFLGTPQYDIAKPSDGLTKDWKENPKRIQTARCRSLHGGAGTRARAGYFRQHMFFCLAYNDNAGKLADGGGGGGNSGDDGVAINITGRRQVDCRV